ncbi:hypothetical protein AA313_de0204220 [Arthrobotrys entomopaga]|nr:hypothetical protein AA313_de0204220 [Arthrobotrys entomopaga]
MLPPLHIAMEPSYENPLKRKRESVRQRGWAEGKDNSPLHLAAAAALSRHLGMHVEPSQVRFNGRPFSRGKTIYIWKVHGELTDEESKVIENTISCVNRSRRLRPCRWGEMEITILVKLIERDALIPESHDDESDIRVETTDLAKSNPTSQDIYTTPTEQNMTSQDALPTPEPTPQPPKRPRELKEAEVTAAPANEEDQNDGIQPKRFSVVRKRCSVQQSNVSVKTTTTQSTYWETILGPKENSDVVVTDSPIEPSEEEASPETVDAPQNRIGSLPPNRTESPPPNHTGSPPPNHRESSSPNRAESLSPAPVAMLSYDPILTIAPAPTSRNNHSDSEVDEEEIWREYEEKQRTTMLIDNMRDQMQAFSKGATVGYLDASRLKKEMRRAKKAHRAREKQLDMQIDVLCQSNNALKAQCLSIEKDCAALTTEKQTMQDKFISEQRAMEERFTSEQRTMEEIFAFEQQTTEEMFGSERHSIEETFTLQQKIVQGKLDSLQKDHDALQETNATLQSRNDKLMKETLANEQKSWQEKLALLQKDHDAIKEINITLQSGNCDLIKERDRLHETVEKNKKWAETIEAKIVTLEKHVSVLEEIILRYAVEEKDLKDQIGRLDSELNSTRQKNLKKEAVFLELEKMLKKEKAELVAQNEALVAENGKHQSQMKSLWQILRPSR